MEINYISAKGKSCTSAIIGMVIPPFRFYRSPWHAMWQFLMDVNQKMLNSLKLTASFHLKIDGWKTILCFWGPGYFQGLLQLVLGKGNTIPIVFQIHAQKVCWVGFLGSKYLRSQGVWKPREFRAISHSELLYSIIPRSNRVLKISVMEVPGSS